jgi:hypothetical protein
LLCSWLQQGPRDLPQQMLLVLLVLLLLFESGWDLPW